MMDTTPSHKPSGNRIIEVIEALNNAIYLVKIEMASMQKQLTILDSRLEYLQKRVDIIAGDDK